MLLCRVQGTQAQCECTLNEFLVLPVSYSITMPPNPLTSRALVNADAHALLDGHPPDGTLRSELWLGRKLFHQNTQDRVHFLVHLTYLNLTRETS